MGGAASETWSKWYKCAYCSTKSQLQSCFGLDYFLARRRDPWECCQHRSHHTRPRNSLADSHLNILASENIERVRDNMSVGELSVLLDRPWLAISHSFQSLR